MWINESEISPYLRDIKKIKVLTPSEEDAMIEEHNADNSQALQNKLISANLRYVITVAKEYQNQGLPFQDLIGEGNYGLTKAARRFDSTKGVRFYSYAVWWIRQAIMQALNEHSRTIRLPVNVINDMSANKKDMTDQEYGNWCVRQGVLRTQSLNQRIYTDGHHESDGNELIDMIAGGDNDAFKTPSDDGTTLPTTLQQVMGILNERERGIIMLYYGLDGCELTLQQIADDMGLTKERVRQIKNQAVKKLRFNAPLLFKFFEN
jgi:RNA polymerase primary sigma factor